jgi:DNA primase
MVSMPLRWDQVTSRLDMRRYTIKTVPRLLAKQKADPLADVLLEAADLPGALERLARLMSAR